MMRSVDVNGWVEDQWEHYVEEGSEVMARDDIRELIVQAFTEWGLGEVPSYKFESLLEMRADANSDYLEKADVKDILVELVLKDCEKRR